MDWIRVAQNRQRGRDIVNAVIEVWFSVKCMVIFDYLENCKLLQIKSTLWS